MTNLEMRTERLNLRLTAAESAALAELAKRLNTTKTAAVMIAVKSLLIKRGAVNGGEETNA